MMKLSKRFLGYATCRKLKRQNPASDPDVIQERLADFPAPDDLGFVPTRVNADAFSRRFADGRVGAAIRLRIRR